MTEVRTESYREVKRSVETHVRHISMSGLPVNSFTMYSPLTTDWAGRNITESITGYRGRRMNVNNDCDHYVSRFQSLPFDLEGPEYLYADYGSYVDLRTEKVIGASGHPWVIPSLFVPLSGTVIERFFNEGVSSTLEQIPVSVSVPNFILELDELNPVKVAESLHQLLTFGYSNLKSLKLALGTKGGRRTLVQKTSGTWANSHLAYQFGVKPLIDDVKKAFGLMQSISDRIAYLKRTRGKPTKIKRTKTFVLEPLAWSDHVSFRHDYNTCDVAQTKWSPLQGITTLSMGLTFVQDLQGLDDLRSQILALNAAAGFNRPLSVIWEALPFSFLIDYVVNAGSVFERFQMYEPFAGSITCLGGWSWTKTEESSYLEYKSTNPYGQGICGFGYRKMFSRRAGIPTNQGLSFSNKLTSTQSANLVALVRAAL